MLWEYIMKKLSFALATASLFALAACSETATDTADEGAAAPDAMAEETLPADDTMAADAMPAEDAMATDAMPADGAMTDDTMAAEPAPAEAPAQ